MNNFKHSLFLLMALALPSALSAQVDSKISEQFLNSLPKNLADSLEQNADLTQQRKDEERLNNKPETRVLKLEQGIAKIKKDLNNLEDGLAQNLNPRADQGLELFGSSFFSSYQSTFSPINEVNFASDYILDYEDKLSFLLVGGLSEKASVRVLQDGSISIPGVGNVHVAGLSYENATKKIQAFVQSRQPGVEIFISLESARNIKVMLVGMVPYPGIYTISGGSSVLSLLHAAGGIDEGGSMRSILHKRAGQVEQQVDLYDALINGDLRLSTNLRSGDVVSVQPAMRKASISGGINYPAIYELLPDESLQDLINYAMGFSTAANIDNDVIIEQANGGQLFLSNSAIANSNIANGDNVLIPMFQPASQEIFTSEILGGIKKPGIYSFRPGDTLAMIIERAGGYTDDAYPPAGKLYREDAAKLQKEYFTQSYQKLITYIATKGDTPATVSSLTSSPNLEYILAEIRNIEPNGRVLTEFNLGKIKKDASLDTYLRADDRIVIPRYSSEVTIVGEVQLSGSKSYTAGKDFNHYVDLAGGFARFADAKKVMIIEPNGNAYLAESNRSLFSSSRDIMPGSIIYAPRNLGKVDGISLASTLAPVMSSIAISLASLNSINN